MESLKNFWSQYKGAIIGVIVAILILCTKLYDVIIAIVGNYIQQNKDSVKEKLKEFIDRL